MKKATVKNKRLAIVSVSIIFLFTLGAYALKTAYHRPSADLEPYAAAEKTVGIPPAEDKNVSMKVLQKKTAEPELGQSINTSASSDSQTLTEKNAATENPVKILKQIVSYRYNPSPETIATLSAFLDYEDQSVASEAIEVLRFIALTNATSNQQEAVAEILKAKAEDPSYNLRDKALYAAAEIAKEDVLPIIAEYINNMDEATQTAGYDIASRALALIRNETTIPYLGDLLSKVDTPEIRRNCYETLATINSYESLSIITTELETAQGIDQIAGAKALARTKDPEGIAFLAQSIQTQKFSPETIAQLSYSPGAPDVFDSLLNNDMITEVQRTALLDTIAEYSVEGNRNLREGMTDMLASYIENTNSSKKKIMALKGIAAIGEERAPEILMTYLDSGDAQLRKEAVLNFTNYTNQSNYEALFDLLWDEDEKVRRTAMVSLERFAGAEDIEILEKAAHHNDEFISKHAGTLLSELQN